MTPSADQVAMIGTSPAMMRIKSHIAKLAPKSFHVLIFGESGTGKELVAKSLHALSGRCGRLVVMNCAEVSEQLFESRMFGHEKGSFSGADRRKIGLVHEAQDGTLFLDEGGELSLENQAKLLRVLEEGEVLRVGATLPERINVRVILATNRDVEQMVREGKFREDLYYRLRAGIIRLPPVRERGGEDIRLLARHFVETDPNLEGMSLSSEVLVALEAFNWPGNVRQIRGVLREVSIEGTEVKLTDLDRVLLGQPDFGNVRIVIPSPSTHVGNAIKRRRQDTQALILEHLEARETLRSRELAERCARSRSTIWRHLRRLQQEKLVVAIGNGPSRRYALAEKVANPVRSKPLGERRAIALQLATEHGRIRRLDLMRLTHVSARTATRDLAVLANAGQLTKIGTGRGAHYVLVTRVRLPQEQLSLAA